MIQINLLPIKKAKRRATAKRELIAYLVITILAVFVVAFLYFSAQSRLSDVTKKHTQLSKQLEEDKASIGDTPAQEKRREELKQQLAILNDLQKRRTGPVRVLDELQEMLSPPRNREASLIQAQKNWNVDWDPRRLWIDDLVEKNGAFTLNGSAENADDVAEFMRRLETADHFSDIALKVVEATQLKGGSSRDRTPRIVKFTLSGTISYAPKKTDEDTAAAAAPPAGNANNGVK